MSVTFPKLRIGQPVSHEALTVYPLFAEANGQIEYVLSDEAITAKSIVIEEVSEGGSVPELLVENQGDSLVLFLEGEELVGAKQNRILNTSVLIAAKSKTKIPVSCVEQGRWSYKSRKFASSGSHSPAKLRRALKASVSRSVRRKEGHRSDQGEVWREVAAMRASHEVDSTTDAMSDVFEARQDRAAEFRKRVKYVPEATGVAVALGGKPVSMDIFDKPTTCEKLWDRLLSGFILDALETGPTGRPTEAADLDRLLIATNDLQNDLQWEQANAIGEGEEYRAESPRDDLASVLIFEGSLVHGSVIIAE